MILSYFFAFFFLVLGGAAELSALPNSTYYNPVLSGWHSDPSCIHQDGMFYCATSSFLSFPGIPVYASKDLMNWKLISWAFNRDSQLPGLTWATSNQKSGFWAPTIRWHDGVFYIICAFQGPNGTFTGTIFKSTDPFSDDPYTWSDPVIYKAPHIDPDLFWDDDGKVYTASAGIYLNEIDLETGNITTPVNIWNGTGLYGSDEGPHVYKKDGYYYVLIAEGGTGLSHSICIARSTNIYGPYENYTGNPILTARSTSNYFQTVGHGDLFQDANGNWWGMCLSIRSGPEYKTYPMGREAVLFPVTWNEGEWPILEPVQGQMNGWALPPSSRDVPGNGPFNLDPDVYDFSEMKEMPKNMVYWRVPPNNTFSTTPQGLAIVPTRNNITGELLANSSIELSGQRGLAFVGRRQTHSLFTFSVDLTFSPNLDGQEAGVSVFVTQLAHIDLGVVRQSSQLFFRFGGEGRGTLPTPNLVAVPPSWTNAPIRLQIQAVNETHYQMSALSSENPNAMMIIGLAPGSMVSGNTGSYVGSLLGAYATCNGLGTGVECPNGGIAHFNKWSYSGKGQYISHYEVVPTA